MTIKSSGPLSLYEIQTEFGGAEGTSLSEYYAGGPYVSNPPPTSPYQSGPIPVQGSGQPIQISMFYGVSSYSTVLSSASFVTNPIQQFGTSNLTVTFTGMTPSVAANITFTLSPSSGLTGLSGSTTQSITADSSGFGATTIPYTVTGTAAQSVVVTNAAVSKTANLTVLAPATFTDLYWNSGMIRDDFWSAGVGNVLNMIFTGGAPNTAISASISVTFSWPDYSEFGGGAYISGPTSTYNISFVTDSSGNATYTQSYNQNSDTGPENMKRVTVVAFSTTRSATFQTFSAGS